MIALKEERVEVDNVASFTEFILLILQLLGKYLVLCFLAFRFINNRCKECQIFLQRLMTRSMTSVNDTTAQLGLILFFARLF